MKLNIKLLSDNKSVTLDINDTEVIESLCDSLNLNQNSTENYYFIYNKLICTSGKTLSELEFIDDCIVFAAKKSEMPLKRKLENQDLANILAYGCPSKKTCTLNGEDLFDHSIWRNTNLSDIQKSMNEIVQKNPFVFEPLILQSQVEQMVHNPSIIHSLYSCNPTMNDIIEKTPERVKFFSDLSQYEWIQNVISDSSEMERVQLHYTENYKNIMDSKRYKRMQEILTKVDGITADESETLESPGYDENSLGVFVNSQYIQNLSDLLAQDKELSEKVLKSCPYGQNMCDENVTEIQNVLPQAMNTLKKAVEQCGDAKSIYKYLQDNPIYLEEDVAKKLEDMTGELPEDDVSEEADDTKISEMVGKISSWVNLTPEESKVARDYNEELELLNEMGFSDNAANLKMLSKEYGSVNRAAILLAAP